MCSLTTACERVHRAVVAASCPVHAWEAVVKRASSKSVTTYVWNPRDKMAKCFSHPRQKRSLPQAVVEEAGNPGGPAVPVVDMIMAAQASCSMRTFRAGVWLYPYHRHQNCLEQRRSSPDECRMRIDLKTLSSSWLNSRSRKSISVASRDR